MGVDQRMHLAVDLGLRQRLDNEVALPGAVALAFPMLDGAAAAGSKMRAERRDALRACPLDLQQAPAVGMVTGSGRHLDRLAAERVGYIEGLAIGKRDPVAEMADMVDGEALNHGARP